jgi:hypothetical protein
MTMTTIKVPVELRDRLAEVARRKNIPMAAAIAQALDTVEEQQFWDAVRRAHANMPSAQRESYVSDPTLTDDLDDAADDALSARGEW